MLVRNKITYILKQATQSISLAFCLKVFFFFVGYIFRLKLDLEVYFLFFFFQMLLPSLLQILEKSESMRERSLFVRKRESWRERKKKRWICATCQCVWNTTCTLLVSSDSSWDRSAQRLEGILWESNFICACYVRCCCCSTWISVPVHLLNPQRSWCGQAPFRKNMIVAPRIVVSLLSVSWLKHTATTER